MKHLLIKVLIPFTLMLMAHFAFAGNYSVKVGEQIQVNCTASAPADYITHAFFNYVDPNDARYLGISYTTSDCRATFYGLEGKANIPIEVTYAYSYTGSYDHNIHVGHSTYRDYITVVGGVKPTDVTIAEGDVEMFVGQELKLHAKLTPSNAETNFTWGFLDALGEPYKFNLTYIGGTATVTSNRPGSVYVVCQTDNDHYAFCYVTSKESDVDATEISLKDEEIKIAEDETYTLKYNLTPEYASNKVTWSSSNEEIATVNSSGKVTAMSAGTATITASTDNGLKAQTKVIVTPKLKALNLPTSKQIVLGFSEKLTPTLTPSNSEEKLKWKSSDTAIATVDSNGVIQSKQTGTVTITVYTSSGIEASTTIEVVEDKYGLNYRNIRNRINKVQKLADKTFDLNRK